MKAAIFHTPQDFAIEDIPYPKLEPDSVIIKVKECGICGSDLHFFNSWKQDGTLLGHEFSGDVVEIGSQVTGVKTGDRVVAAGGRGCGTCYWCRTGQYIHCSRLGFVGYAIPGAFAEYCAMPAFKIGQYAAKLPKSIAYDVGATAEPLAVALYAVNQTRPKPENTAVVIGLGIIGLCIVQILKSRGIKTVIASGRRPYRLKLAKESGADIVLDAARDDVTASVMKATASRGADFVYECAGNESSFNQAVQITHRGGVIDLVGLYEQSFTWNPSVLVGNDLSLVGCGLRWDLPGAVRLLKNGAVSTAKMITHSFPLEKIREAFLTQMNSPEAIKVMIKLD
ncbi:MAG TPA: alcohol dehydrogenase catalytic domain-containing protein [Dehalococcoidales bacterium]|nr:alcohol dehydrogenase catalytic domain-containing protein [Dehalococcoidales bacterium]